MADPQTPSGVQIVTESNFQMSVCRFARYGDECTCGLTNRTVAAEVEARATADGTWSRDDLALALVGLPEIGRRLGTTAGTVRSWRNRHADFPAPVVELASGPVWVWSDVFAWSEARKQRRDEAVEELRTTGAATFEVL